MKTSESDKPRSIIELTYQRVVDDITAGKYKPGERMSGDRELAKAYGIGRSSMIRVLEELQKDRYVERIPVYGTFVRDDLSSRCQIISIAFVTPNKSLSPEQIGLSNWSAMMEILRGVLEECSARPGVRSTILYCEDTADRGKLRTQLEDLRRFDGVIFCGPLMQSLKQLYVAEGKPAMVVAAKPEDKPEIYPMVSFDSEASLVGMTRYVLECEPKRPILLLHCQVDEVDRKRFRNELRIVRGELELGGATYEELALDQQVQDLNTAMKILEPLFQNKSRFDGKTVWCLNRLMLPVVNHLIWKYRMNTQLFGGNSSFGLSAVHPPVPFLLEPFYEMGREAVSRIAEHLTSGTPLTNKVLEPSIYYGSKRIK